MNPEYVYLLPYIIATAVVLALVFASRRSFRGVYWTLLAACLAVSYVEPRLAWLWKVPAFFVLLWLGVLVVTALHWAIRRLGGGRGPEPPD